VHGRPLRFGAKQNSEKSGNLESNKTWQLVAKVYVPRWQEAHISVAGFITCTWSHVA
jgi:hypothetical protein